MFLYILDLNLLFMLLVSIMQIRMCMFHLLLLLALLVLLSHLHNDIMMYLIVFHHNLRMLLYINLSYIFTLLQLLLLACYLEFLPNQQKYIKLFLDLLVLLYFHSPFHNHNMLTIILYHPNLQILFHTHLPSNEHKLPYLRIPIDFQNLLLFIIQLVYTISQMYILLYLEPLPHHLSYIRQE